jgi:hypothetical protein
MRREPSIGLVDDLSTDHPSLIEQAVELRVERIERAVVDCEFGGRNLYLVIDHLPAAPPTIPGWFRLALVDTDPPASVYARHRRWWSRADRREWRRRVEPILRRHRTFA